MSVRGDDRGTASVDVDRSDAGTGSLDGVDRPLSRRLLVAEVWLVFGVSLGASALWAAVRYIGDLTAPGPLRSQVAELNSSAAPGRPWLDLALQLVGVATALVPALLALYLLVRDGGGPSAIGFDRREPIRDICFGAGLAALVGGAGLGLYLLAWHSGANLTVVPTSLPDVWWRIPVLLLSAVENAVLEEVVVVGYLLTRLRQVGCNDRSALATSAILRGSYHLYQGLGGFVANLIMGLLFGRIYQRWGRIGPLVVAHSLIDSVAFVGYATLAGRVSWLPTP
ncbi:MULTISPECIES: CPBP family intramembrane glutamic endopeptidase [unclassified Frankia]|uniref:CPBP family intramembrane glutamic endopeptidase n=1 Tax=unclassified Frankia TaxID=2632575 RepID=UPI002AD2812D|nr:MULTISPECIES: CPBP family intramembrane glutamic endopeptidase [unclassified Frankia]